MFESPKIGQCSASLHLAMESDIESHDQIAGNDSLTSAETHADQTGQHSHDFPGDVDMGNHCEHPPSLSLNCNDIQQPLPSSGERASSSNLHRSVRPPLSYSRQITSSPNRPLFESAVLQPKERPRVPSLVLIKPLEEAQKSSKGQHSTGSSIDGLGGLSFESPRTVLDFGFGIECEEHVRRQLSIRRRAQTLSSQAGIHVEQAVPNCLQAELDAAFVNSKDTCARHLEYLPRDGLFWILNPERVKQSLIQELPEESEHLQQEILRRICDASHGESLRMVFAILVLIGKAVDVVHFYNNNTWDVCLPVRQPTNSIIKGLGDKRKDPKRTACGIFPEKWDGPDRRGFLTVQYQIVIPFFNMSCRQLCFPRYHDSNIILPIVFHSNPTRGGYGTVWKASIHPAHHSFEDLNVCKEWYMLLFIYAN
jgi:hypothetical protein